MHSTPSPLVSIALLSGALGACADRVDEAARGNAAVPTTTSASAVAPSPAPIPTPAAAALVPEPVTPDDLRGAGLRGELMCSFSRQAGAPAILLAAADVDPEGRPEAAFKPAGRILKLAATETGGFEALERGIRFAGPDGLSVIVKHSGDALRETPNIAGESLRYAGLLLIRQGEREEVVQGAWECGP